MSLNMPRHWNREKAKAYKAGRLAYGGHGDITRNSHALGSTLSSQFNRGYYDAKAAWELLIGASTRMEREKMASDRIREFVELYDKALWELKMKTQENDALKQTIRTLLNDRKI